MAESCPGCVDPLALFHQFQSKKAAAHWNQWSPFHGLTKTARPLYEETRRQLEGPFLGHAFPFPLEIKNCRIVRPATLPAEYGPVWKELAPVLKSWPDLPETWAMGHSPAKGETEIARRVLALASLGLATCLLEMQGAGKLNLTEEGGEILVSIEGAHGGLELWPALQVPLQLWAGCRQRRVGQVHWGAPKTGVEQKKESAAERALGFWREQLEQCASRVYGLSFPADEEYVHEMRVALRRMRSALKIFKSFFHTLPPDFAKDLKYWARLLGQARDQDVFLRFLETARAASPASDAPFYYRFIRARQRWRRETYSEVGARFQSEEFGRFLEETRQALEQGTLFTPKKKGKKALEKNAPALMEKGLDRLQPYLTSLDYYDEEGLHQLRIECKRLRYLAEMLGDCFSDNLKKLRKTATAMQDALGEVHDCQVYGGWITAYMERSPLYREEEQPNPAGQRLLEQLDRHRLEHLKQAKTLWQKVVEEGLVEKWRETLRKQAKD